MAVSISAKAAATASAWLVVFSLLFGVNNLIDRNYAVGQNATPTGTESPTFTCHLSGLELHAGQDPHPIAPEAVLRIYFRQPLCLE